MNAEETKERHDETTSWLFTGFDSAWGGRQSGAICDMRGYFGKMQCVLTIEYLEAVDWPRACQRVEKAYAAEARHVVAIDQGLVVPNAVGQRPVERLLASALMKDFQCGAHSSNTSPTGCYGPNGGIWNFIDLLETRKYRQEPMAVPGATDGRFYFECYPHPAIIALLDLGSKLDYKVKKRNPTAWGKLCDYLSGLQGDEVRPISNARDILASLHPQNKEHEDKLDSIIAAYIAAYFWLFGASRSTVLGSLTTGYIVTPHTARTKALFEDVFAGALNPVGTAHSCRPSGAVASGSTPSRPTRAEPSNVLDVPDVGPDFVWAGPVELTVSDTANVWSNRNPWLLREKCEGHDLFVKIIEEDEPVLRFVPFDNEDRRQGGMGIGAGDTQGTIWRHLASGASSKNTISYTVLYRFIAHAD